jgi:Undecaprenyl-phosphate galactose phosphotransferase WbaP
MWGKPVAILGAGESGAQLVQSLQREWGLGFKPVAVFDFRLAPAGGELEGVPYGGSLTDAIDTARELNIDTVVFAMPQIQRKYLARLVDAAGLHFHNVVVIPNLGGITNSAIVARDFAGICGVEIKHNLLNPWSRVAKRALDLFGALVGGLLISPLLLAMVVLIKLDTPGPLFYSHMRLGTEGKHFYCWKFRTMYTDASQLLTELLERNPSLRSEWEENHKLRNDPRVTRVGRFLRKTSLDELPQLWNVLRGEMSLTGPRPIVDAEAPKYGEAYQIYQRVKPGVTGLWQVSGRSDTSYEERVAIDTYYVRDWSVWLDIVILARTVKAATFGRGAC